jgi:hypothetical protein
MEIAHARTGTFRIIAKIILVGLLVILLTKVLLALVVLALVGALLFTCARGLYTRKSRLRRLLHWIEERLLRSLVMVLQTTAAVLVAAAGWFSRTAAVISLRSSRSTLINARKLLGTAGWLLIATVSRSILLSYALLCYAAKTSWAMAWKIARLTQGVLVVPVRGATRATASAWATLRNQWSLICGFLVEIASGTLVGAMLGFLFLPHVHPIGIKVCGAAVFGAFLGITVGLSRITWPGRVS